MFPRNYLDLFIILLITSPLNTGCGLIHDIFPSASADFILVENSIDYVHWPNQGIPCEYLISGNVTNLAGNAYTNFVVNIQTAPLPDFIPEGPFHAFPNNGSFQEDGPSGYVITLPNWQVDYEIWLTGHVNGRAISEHVIVPTRDCDHNRAIVNFVQVND